jgi:hypothetical protein
VVKKGQPLGSGNRIAKTEYCSFSTLDQMSTNSGNAHLAFLLEMIESRLAAIRDVMTAQSLTWVSGISPLPWCGSAARGCGRLGHENRSLGHPHDG